MKPFRRCHVNTLVLLGMCGFLLGCGASRPNPPLAQASLPYLPDQSPASSSAVGGHGAPFRFFSESSIWNAPVSGAPVDPQSAQFVAALAELVAAEGGAGINTTRYSVPVYTVGR